MNKRLDHLKDEVLGCMDWLVFPIWVEWFVYPTSVFEILSNLLASVYYWDIIWMAPFELLFGFYLNGRSWIRL